MDARCRVHRATAADLPALGRLERACFSDPWSEASLREAMTAPGALSLAAERAGHTAGYLIARVIAGVAEILTIGVDPGHRRHGVGNCLLEHTLALLRSEGAHEVWLEVRESNHAAQAMYRGLGFRPGGMRRAYYRRPTEDALVLKLDLTRGSA